MMVGQNLINEKDNTQRSYRPNRRGHTAPRIPKSETKRQNEASRLKPQGRREADRDRSCNARVNVWTYITRTLRTDDDTHRLCEELGSIKSNAVGLCETNRRGKGLRELSRVEKEGGGGDACMK